MKKDHYHLCFVFNYITYERIGFMRAVYISESPLPAQKEIIEKEKEEAELFGVDNIVLSNVFEVDCDCEERSNA